MQGQGTKLHGSYSSRSMGFILDLLHIVIGVIIVVLAIISFLNAESNLVLFPVIFMLAAVLNLVNGWVKICQSGRNRKKLAAGSGILMFGVCLVTLSVISALSIWG